MRRIALALLAAPFALAACGGGKKSSVPSATLTPVAYVKQAAQKTDAAPSEHMTLNGAVALGGQGITLDGSGDFDNKDKSGTFHMRFSAGGMSGTIDEVMTGTTLYAKSPLFASSLPSGKTWMKLDLRKPLAARGVDLSSLMAQSPSQSISQLLASTNATKVGTETIDGASTTHYHGTVDLAKLPQAAALPGAVKADEPFDVWVDDSTGYVRRVKLTNSLGGASVVFTMDFSSFGEQVSAQAPPASETYDATSSTFKGLTP